MQEGIPGLPQPPGPPDWDGLPPPPNVQVGFSREVLIALSRLPAPGPRVFYTLLAHVRPDGTTSMRLCDVADFAQLHEQVASRAVWQLRDAGLIFKVGVRAHGVAIWRFNLDMPFGHLTPPNQQRAERN